jgi:hypothetical protein
MICHDIVLYDIVYYEIRYSIFEKAAGPRDKAVKENGSAKKQAPRRPWIGTRSETSVGFI